jgi:hypothetical protein
MCPFPDNYEPIQPATRDFHAQQQRSRQLNEFFDEAVAEIRASLEPGPNEDEAAR